MSHRYALAYMGVYEYREDLSLLHVPPLRFVMLPNMTHYVMLDYVELFSTLSDAEYAYGLPALLSPDASTKLLDIAANSTELEYSPIVLLTYREGEGHPLIVDVQLVYEADLARLKANSA